jgi:hypothetical protein
MHDVAVGGTRDSGAGCRRGSRALRLITAPGWEGAWRRNRQDNHERRRRRRLINPPPPIHSIRPPLTVDHDQGCPARAPFALLDPQLPSCWGARYVAWTSHLASARRELSSRHEEKTEAIHD